MYHQNNKDIILTGFSHPPQNDKILTEQVFERIGLG